MLRTVIVTAALLLGAGVANADDVFACRTLAGGAPVTLNFKIAHASDTYSINEAALQLDGKDAYATGATDPAALATIANLDLDNKVEFYFQREGEDAVRVNLVTRFEGGGDIASGTVTTKQGDVWVMRCDVTHEG